MEDAAAVSRTLDQTLAKASLNLSPEEITRFKEITREGALAVGVKQAEFGAVLANDLGAGAASLEEADQAARISFRATGGQTAEARELSAVALDFKSKAGGSFETAAGLIPQISKLSRATDQAQNFGNINPAILAGTVDRASFDGFELE